MRRPYTTDVPTFTIEASPSPWARSRIRVSWAELALLVSISLPLLFVGLGFSFLDMGEGLYGTVPGEMLRGGDWIFPHFNGLPYLEKPPLYFWVTAATMALGVSAEWAARLWSALPALGSVLLAWRLGVRLYGGRVGLLAGIALATSAGFVQLAHRASADQLTVFCLTLALYGFVRDLDRPTGSTRFLIFYLGIGLGLMAKGLIGALFPLTIVGTWLAWTRRVALRQLNVWRGAALVGLVALPWHVAIGLRNSDHLWFYLVDNQALRFLNRRGFLEDDVQLSALGFLVVTFLLFFPWSVFVLSPRERSRVPEGDSLTAIWAITVIGFFLCSGSRLEYYALPAFPALALRAAAAWYHRRGIGLWLILGTVGSVLVGLWACVAGAGLTADQALAGLAELNVYYRILRNHGLPFPFVSARPFGLLLQGLGVALVLGWIVAAACWLRARPRCAFAALTSTAGGIGVLIVQLLYLIEPHHSAQPVASALLERASPRDVVVHEGSLDYSSALPLYAARQVLVLNGRRGDLEFASRLPEAKGVFLDDAEFVRLWQGERPVFLVTQRPPEKSVIGQLAPSTVHEIGLFGSRRLFSNH